MGYLFMFLAGLLTGLCSVFIWKALEILSDSRAAEQRSADALRALQSTPKDAEAQRAVVECKNRLRWQRSLNPEWIQPLLVEVPRLVREIAAIYYPAERSPLLAPGLSHFACAMQLTAQDVSTFLQTKSVGRLVDVSAKTALDAWNKGKEVVASEQFRYATKWYRRLLPIYQTIRYKSPIMWASLAVSNVAVRALQPAVIDLVARRAIELYSGRLVVSQDTRPVVSVQPLNELPSPPQSGSA
jgi:hypothetical protein